MSDIPTDVFREILRHVPVESLFRFRSVCKAWCRIIDDPNFAQLHINHGVGEDCLFIRTSTSKLYSLSLKCLRSRTKGIQATHMKTPVGHIVPGLHDFPVPSCNGLILIPNDMNDLCWVVWNPFTGELLELPVLKELRSAKCRFSPCGIGYDAANNDYKVVRAEKTCTYAYSVNSRDWRRIEDFPNGLIGQTCGVFAHGALHWFTYSLERCGDAYSFDRSKGVGCVVALDLTTETYRKLPLPPEINGAAPLTLDGLNGSLFLSCLSLGGYFVVWMMKDYGYRNTWVMIMALKQKENVRSMSLIVYSKSENQFLLRYNGEQLLWYDVDRKHTQRVSIKGITDLHRKDLIISFSSFVYPASIVRLKRNSAAKESIVSKGKSKTEDASTENLELEIIASHVRGSHEDW